MPIRPLFWLLDPIKKKRPLSELWRSFFIMLWRKGLEEIEADRDEEENRNIQGFRKRNNTAMKDRPREGEAYLDGKQNHISFPACFFRCVCVCVHAQGCVYVISLYRDSLMAFGIVNRRSHWLPPLTSTTAVQSVGSTLTKSRTHILAESLSLITAGQQCSVCHIHSCVVIMCISVLQWCIYLFVLFLQTHIWGWGR